MWLLCIAILAAVALVVLLLVSHRDSKKPDASPTLDADYPGAAPGAVVDRPSGGMAALGLFIPLAGFIVYAVQYSVLPLRAKSALKGAIAGVIVYVVVSVLVTIYGF